ncbi:MAG: alpha/beta hydrolase-fold protein [Candidatus Eisenbacteria bacterium]
MRAALLLALGIGAATPAGAAVHFVVRPPGGTPAGQALHVSGDLAALGSWDGKGITLAPAADGTWRGMLTLPAGTAFEFKVTRGGWDTVEKEAGGGERANRRAVATAGEDTLRIDVAAWRDQTEAPGAARAHTITGTVARHEAFPSKHVASRDIAVWLPPGYERQSLRRYGVVYFHDGQNVFDGATSFIPGQEWRADEAADGLIRAGRIPPVIMVAVPNTAARVDEYTFENGGPRGGGKSDDYFRFLVEELMPFINANYRTLTDPAHTTVIGSSLGGLASLDLGFAHPERFGRIGCVSPAVWWADTAIVGRVRTAGKQPLRIWLDIGTAESTSPNTGRKVWLDHARVLRDALVNAGWREGADLHYEEIEGAAHNEAAWAARISRILEYLLAP